MNSYTRAVFFDLDGTLIDSIGLIVDCFQHATKTHLGYEIPREEVLKKIGRPLRPELERLAPGRGEELIATYREMQFGKHDECIKPFPHAAEMLITLRDQKIPTGVVTSKARRGTQEALKLFGESATHIDIRITVEDCENHKPHPEPLLIAAQYAQVDPAQCVYVGDTVFDMQAAVAAGMKPIGVTWGVATREDLSEYTDLIFDDVRKLRDVLSALQT